MLDVMNLMPPRSPTFFERMRWTYGLLRMGLPMPATWLPIVWSSGATASISPIHPKSARLDIESANGDKTLSVTVSIKRVT